LLAATRLELAQLRQQRLFVALTVLGAMSLLAMVSLFALTGSDAPLAVVDEDRSGYSRRFADALAGVPHAFSLRPLDRASATRGLESGQLVGVLTLPAGFEARVSSGETVPLDVQVDNVNTDLVFDLQRALPSAILAFGHSVGLPGLRATLDEHDLLPKDIPFLRYLAVSALALVALVIASALAALVVTREREGQTLKLLRLAPAGMGAALAGKLLASLALSTVAILAAALVVMLGYGVVPVAPVEAAGILLVCLVTFTSMGAWLGALLRRTLPVVPLVFGLAMPLYIDCGALEPTRFDGETLWALAHASPLYYAVGALQWAFFGVRVTPEPLAVNLGVLLALALASAGLAAWQLSRTARFRSC
jgi:ABC-2 type transport system permease protein